MDDLKARKASGDEAREEFDKFQKDQSNPGIDFKDNDFLVSNFL